MHVPMQMETADIGGGDAEGGSDGENDIMLKIRRVSPKELRALHKFETRSCMVRHNSPQVKSSYLKSGMRPPRRISVYVAFARTGPLIE